MAWPWEEHVLKRHVSVFIREFASVNVLMLVEPTFQPIARLALPKGQIVGSYIEGVGRDSVRSSRLMSCPPEHEGSENDNCSHHHLAEFSGNEAKQKGDDHSQPNSPKHEYCCNGHTHETHHKKANGNK
jgi:hypothetical protein